MSRKFYMIIIGLAACCFAGFCNMQNTSAWIGTGSGSSGSSGGSSSQVNCSRSSSDAAWSWQIECSGASWAFYKATSKTNSETTFPYVKGSYGINEKAKIPAECSQYGGTTGFWHFGPNNLGGVYLNNGELWVSRSKGWVGHWATYSRDGRLGSYVRSHIKTPGNINKQHHKVGVYRFDKFGSTSTALKAYKQTWVYEQHRKGNTGANMSNAPSSIPDNVWGFCWSSAMTEVTLTVKAIDSNGNSLSGLMADKTVKGSPGTTLSATVGGIDGYSKVKWGTNTSSSSWWDDSNMTYSASINSDTTIYAVYKYNRFYGKSSVSGATSGDTGWVNTDTSKAYYINNCSAVNGCSASFKHEMMRDSGGSSPYTVSRTSNLTDTSRGIANKTVKTGTFNTNSGTVSTSGTLTLYPGMVVCERLTFNTTNTASPGRAYSEVCVSALGNAQPSDPPNPDAAEDPNKESGDASFINIKVRNQSVAKYNNYQRTVYAKPGDRLSYRATYNPVLQYTYYLKPQQMRIDGGTVHNGGGSILGSLFNLYNGSLPDWNNGFSIQFAYDSNFSGVLKNIKHSAGDFSKKSDINSYNAATGVLASEVGKSLDERAITNLNSTVSTTPSQVSFANNGGNNLGNVITTSQNKIAMAKVPYNFNTDISVTTPDTTLVYAGETTTIDFNITIKPKHNNETMNGDDLDYATIVGDPKYKLIVYRGGEQGGTVYNNDNLCGYYGLANNQEDCGYSEETDGGDTFKNGIGLHSETTRKLTRTFNAQDTSAGSKICVAAAFFPASSGSDTNMDPKGDNSWRISDSKCYTIAKKPSLQIWGGNFFSNSNISAAVAVKNNVAGLAEHTYSVSKPNAYSYVFGTWGELGLVSSGAIKGVASGAYTGYTANDNGTPIATPGGSKEEHTKVNFCKRGVMTFANEPCNGSSLGSLGNTISTANASEDKSSIISNFTSIKRDGGGNDMNRVSGEVVLNDEAKKNDRGVYYYHNESENLTIPVSTVNPGALQMVTSGKSIMITGDIVYGTPDAGYTNIDQMPKLVLYARDNVYINCHVKRIDAIIIAENTVITCGDFNTDLETSSIKANINRRENSNQLTINGTVISDRLIANRTYGAATGNNSIISGEIINYDSTNYVWQNWKSDGGAGAQMKVTYTKELSPRY